MNRTLLVASATLLVMGTLVAPAIAAPEPASLVCDNTPRTALSGTYKNVKVRPGASCYLADARVTGNFVAVSPRSVKIVDTPVARNLKVTGATHNVVIGNRGCRFDPTVGNNIVVKRSHNVAICWMTVKNNIVVSQNDGRITLQHNTAGRSIKVTNNFPYARQPGDGGHRQVAAIRFRHNTAGNHNIVRNNSGRRVIGGDNTPAITR